MLSDGRCRCMHGCRHMCCGRTVLHVHANQVDRGALKMSNEPFVVMIAIAVIIIGIVEIIRLVRMGK